MQHISRFPMWLLVFMIKIRFLQGTQTCILNESYTVSQCELCTIIWSLLNEKEMREIHVLGNEFDRVFSFSSTIQFRISFYEHCTLWSLYTSGLKKSHINRRVKITPIPFFFFIKIIKMRFSILTLALGLAVSGKFNLVGVEGACILIFILQSVLLLSISVLSLLLSKNVSLISKPLILKSTPWTLS